MIKVFLPSPVFSSAIVTTQIEDQNKKRLSQRRKARKERLDYLSLKPDVKIFLA
jgi:hypothetical protein